MAWTIEGYADGEWSTDNICVSADPDDVRYDSRTDALCARMKLAEDQCRTRNPAELRGRLRRLRVREL